MAVLSLAVVLLLQSLNSMKKAELARLTREGRAEEWDAEGERRRLGDRHVRFEYTL